MLEPRPYQREAIDSIFNYFFRGGKGNPLIVIPTGAGKSLVQAIFIKEVLDRWPNQKILCLAHRKELLQQNFAEIIGAWPQAPMGMYSAGVGVRQLGRKVTIAGIQSVYGKADKIGWIDLIIIDECHLTPNDGDGMYQTLIKGLRRVNPNIKIIGLTATPYRTKSGVLTDEGGVFTDFAYEVEMSRLIKEGYLSPLTSKTPKVQADLSTVRTRAGEYVEEDVQRVMDVDELTDAAITEMERYCSDRKSWLIFASGVKHAMHVSDKLNERGHTSEWLCADTEDMFRTRHIERFKRQEIKCLVSMDILTTGFNARCVDALMLLRPTKSCGLYVQMVGRGSRLSPETGKLDCMVLDFAGNIERHGPVDAIKIQSKRESDGLGKEVSTAPTKKCPVCDTRVLLAAQRCPSCGYDWPTPTKHDAVATTAPILSTIKPPETLRVSEVTYRKHEKEGKPPSLRVVYHCTTGNGNLAFRMVSEWVCLQHPGYAFEKACEWWTRHHRNFQQPRHVVVPFDIDEALRKVKDLRPVKEIIVRQEGAFERVVDWVFDDARPLNATTEKLANALDYGVGTTNAAATDDQDDIPF
jgi:DNA repair protein RadD